MSFATPTPPLGRGGERAGYWLLGRIPVSFIGPTGHLGHGEQPRGRLGRRGRLDRSRTRWTRPRASDASASAARASATESVPSRSPLPAGTTLRRDLGAVSMPLCGGGRARLHALPLRAALGYHFGYQRVGRGLAHCRSQARSPWPSGWGRGGSNSRAQIKRAPRRVADNGHIGREQASLGLQNGPIGSWRTVSDPVVALKVALTRSRATVGAPLHRASNPWSLRDRPTDSSTDSHRVIAELSARVAAFCAGPGGRQAQLALAGNDHEVVSLMPITCHILAC